jgi:hypothetical protein
MPETADLLLLQPSREDMLLRCKLDEVLEMIRFRITLSRFPLPNRSPRDAKSFCQLDLGKIQRSPQSQHQLTENRISFTIESCLHHRTVFLFAYPTEEIR